MSKKTGDKGEKIAATYLNKKGYSILHTNWRYQHLELDIVAKKDDLLIVVEVKSGNSVDFGDPHEWVTRKKQKRVINAADAYVTEYNIETETRFDVVAILFTSGTAPQVTHIEDAFSPIG
ncbi:MAG: YraN family protein [Bacteroidia bacterium]|nr:YraN family protein [Bacteroidia bacterium]